jgi:hypothetical protein
MRQAGDDDTAAALTSYLSEARGYISTSDEACALSAG